LRMRRISSSLFGVRNCLKASGLVKKRRWPLGLTFFPAATLFIVSAVSLNTSSVLRIPILTLLGFFAGLTIFATASFLTRPLETLPPRFARHGGSIVTSRASVLREDACRRRQAARPDDATSDDYLFDVEEQSRVFLKLGQSVIW